MMRSFIFLTFWACLIQQANGEACESGHWTVHITRSGAIESDCPDVEIAIDAQIEACVKLGSGKRLYRSGHRCHSDQQRRRLLTNPEPRKLRTTPLQQPTTPLQQRTTLPQQEERKLNEVCTSCEDCASWLCQFVAGGIGYCVDTCTPNCGCERRLEADDNQDQERNLDQEAWDRDSELILQEYWDEDSTLEPGSPAWVHTRITRRCGFLLKAFAENMIQDMENNCLGEPEHLIVEALCLDL